MTRLALSSYDLWRDILATNAERIDAALAGYIQELEHIRENLRTRELQEEFARGSELAGKVRASHREVVKGEAWLLAGEGRARAAACLELRERPGGNAGR